MIKLLKLKKKKRKKGILVYTGKPFPFLMKDTDVISTVSFPSLSPTFLVGLGFELRALTKKMLYHRSHTCGSNYFWR
jgi:hypothetical protein